MTTIAWDGVILATDSRMSTNDLIVSDDYNKLERNVGILDAVVFTGSPSKAKRIKDVLEKADTLDDIFRIPYDQEEETLVLFVHECVLWSFLGKDSVEHTEPWAYGSGGDFAIAAMDFGEDARGAVRYAATRDLYTGGVVQSFNTLSSSE